MYSGSGKVEATRAAIEVDFVENFQHFHQVQRQSAGRGFLRRLLFFPLFFAGRVLVTLPAGWVLDHDPEAWPWLYALAALAGIILGPIGLASCVVGVLLTGALLREVREYTEPGPVDVVVETCVVDGRAVRTSGTIENLDDQTHDYSIVIEVIDGGDVVDRDNVPVDGVTAGEVRRWEQLILTRRDTPADADCDIFAVNGPFPFGLDPNP